MFGGGRAEVEFKTPAHVERAASGGKAEVQLKAPRSVERSVGGDVGRQSALSTLRKSYERPGPQAPMIIAGVPLEQIKEEEEEEEEGEKPEEEAREARGQEDDEQAELAKVWETATASAAAARGTPSPWEVSLRQKALGYTEAWRQLAQATPPAEVADLPATEPPKGLDVVAAAELQDLLRVARTKLCDDDTTHLQVLQGVWRALSGPDAAQPVRFGSHWESIGFQGSDPATDLRGVGMLGLLHLLAFHERAPAALARGMAASRDGRGHFPFAAASFNFSKLAMELLLDGKLNGACNKARRAEPVVTALYIGAFGRLLSRWEHERLSVVDFGRVLQDITSAAGHAPKTFVAAGLEAIGS